MTVWTQVLTHGRGTMAIDRSLYTEAVTRDDAEPRSSHRCLVNTGVSVTRSSYESNVDDASGAYHVW